MYKPNLPKSPSDELRNGTVAEQDLNDNDLKPMFYTLVRLSLNMNRKVDTIVFI